MTYDIPARIDRNRNKLAELRDAKVSEKDLYNGLTFVIGDLYHVQEDTRTAERLAKIEVLEKLIGEYGCDIGGRAMTEINRQIIQLMEGGD